MHARLPAGKQLVMSPGHKNEKGLVPLSPPFFESQFLYPSPYEIAIQKMAGCPWGQFGPLGKFLTGERRPVWRATPH